MENRKAEKLSGMTFRKRKFEMKIQRPNDRKFRKLKNQTLKVNTFSKTTIQAIENRSRGKNRTKY